MASKYTLVVLLTIFILETFAQLYEDILKRYNEYCVRKQHRCNPKREDFAVCKYGKTEYGEDCKNKNAKNIQFTQEQVTKLLETINHYRTQLANGILKFSTGKFYPKGYGIFRVHWDSESAGLAQYISSRCHVPTKFLCIDLKRNSGTYIIFEEYRKTASEVFSRALTRFNPEKYESIDKMFNRNFFILGAVSHIGCGWTTFVHDKNVTDYVVCRYINTIAPYMYITPLYNTTAPIAGRHFSRKCGCPLFTLETENCLCEHVPPQSVKSTKSTTPAYDPPMYKNKRLRGPTEVTHSSGPPLDSSELTQPVLTSQFFKYTAAVPKQSSRQRVIILLPVIAVKRRTTTALAPALSRELSVYTSSVNNYPTQPTVAFRRRETQSVEDEHVKNPELFLQKYYNNIANPTRRTNIRRRYNDIESTIPWTDVI
ncbi:unnamed protein product [Spodoptera littoralis]|uniref:SCP domain-containing protein n=1 Tax=Spodoptera littoralis TaxID=7109 RepID=A0A9P0N5Q6_SPOLI|nr:unnamed protein product [Spodoptera littoralis]CAH1642498.1 unnamed protein product [Spodoptera littoralis]